MRYDGKRSRSFLSRDLRRVDASMRIEFLYWEECPAYPEALARLQTVLEEERIRAPVDIIHVSTEDQAQILRFLGSPTIRIDGADVAAPPGTAQFGLTCRVYYTADGRVTPLPSKEMLRQALRKAGGSLE